MASSPSWLSTRSSSLAIELDAPLRTALAAWLRQVGEANGMPGLRTGTLDARIAQLRRIMGERDVVIWTTPARWATGEGLTLRFPVLGIDVACVLADRTLKAEGLTLAPPDGDDPEHEPGSVGALVRVPRIGFSGTNGKASEAAAVLEEHFRQHAVDRWAGFVQLLGEVVEEQALDEQRRQAGLSFQYGAAAPGARERAWSVSDLEDGSPTSYEVGEWVEVVRPGGAVAGTARVASARTSPPSMEIDAATLEQLPPTGLIRPRSQDKIIRQKRRLVDQILTPTGDLAALVKLVAAPDLAEIPVPRPDIAFLNPLVGRVPSQARAVGLALALEDGQTLLIQGPPGTGKSTTAAEIDLQLIRRNPNVRILVCSHSNHGTDNLLMKVLPFLHIPSEYIARVGFYERTALQARPYFASAESEIGTRNLVFTTIDSLALQDIAGARIYDYVILDEANRASVLDSLLALSRGKRHVLVGDQMQLHPVMTEAAHRVARQASGVTHADIIDTSLFAWLMERGFPDEATVLLDEQNRMHPAIAEVVSRVFYGGSVRTGASAPNEDLAIPGFPSAVTWVDTTSLFDSQESRRGTSLVNVAEADLVAAIVEHLGRFAPPALSIGVIAAYAAQRDLLRTFLAGDKVSPDRQLEVDTVDAFEGREKDIIVLSLVRTNDSREVGFLRLEQRLNVAVSRSRRLLVIVGHVATLEADHFRGLLDAIRDVGQVVQGDELGRLSLIR